MKMLSVASEHASIDSWEEAVYVGFIDALEKMRDRQKDGNDVHTHIESVLYVCKGFCAMSSCSSSCIYLYI